MSSRSSIASIHARVSVVLALIVFSVSLAVPPSPAWATIYYVDANSPAASNSNPGTEAQPWMTIGRATPLVQAGDTVFVKAGVYRETVILSQSGTADKPITIQAYPGHEGQAIINAAEPVTGWRKCTRPGECGGSPHWSHIYWADVAALVAAHPNKDFAVRQVFQHGQRLPRSRYPDTGWSYPTTIVDPRTTFTDDRLSLSRGYLTGAVCHIKTQKFQIDQIPIASSHGSTIVLANRPRFDISTQYGYYVTSVVGEINAEGEWAYDANRQRLYLWPRGETPEDVEFTYRDYCLRTYDGAAFTAVRGLTMRNAYEYGIFLYLAHDMTIENNTVEYVFGLGIHLESRYGPCNDNQILRNTIRYSGNRGINVSEAAARCQIEGNTVYASGVEHYGGDLMNGNGEGIYVVGPFARVKGNRIDRTGRVGLYLHGGALGREVSYNYITNSGLALSDTGGIYGTDRAAGPDKDYIHHNIIVDTPGCQTMDKNHDTGLPVTLAAYAGDAEGIYIDEEANQRIIEDNTAIGSSTAGIYFHWAPGNLVQRNTLYGNGQGQIRLSGKNEEHKMLVEDVLLDNILFATDAQQRTLYFTMNYDDVHFGQSDRNFFGQPFADAHIYLSRYPAAGGVTEETVTLAGWQALSGYDGNSVEFSSLRQHADMTIPEPVQSRIVYNPSLDTMNIDLGADQYCDVQGNKVYGQVSLAPFESKILVAADFALPAPALP